MPDTPNPNHNKVFLYLDNSNIFISAKQVAMEREGVNARSRVRLDFNNLVALSAGGRELASAYAVGSIPPELTAVWNRLKKAGVKISLQERGQETNTEQGVDQALQLKMVNDALDHNGFPGIACLLTGDGKGLRAGEGFYANLQRMHKKGWGIEVLAWEETCHSEMRQWVEEVGVFIPLDEYYSEITFLEAVWIDHEERGSLEIHPVRAAAPITDALLAKRPRAETQT